MPTNSSLRIALLGLFLVWSLASCAAPPSRSPAVPLTKTEAFTATPLPPSPPVPTTVLPPTVTPPAFHLAHRPAPYQFDQPLEYHLYLPESYSPDRAWPLFVGLHGAGGSAWDCDAAWQPTADEYGYVLLCPSLQDPYGGWDQEPKKLVLHDTVEKVRTQAHVQEQVFYAGFSRGAHLAQRMAWAYPDSAAGAAVLSAVIYDRPVPAASRVPFLIVIGDKDHAGGVEEVQEFGRQLQEGGFQVEIHILPDVGHTMTPEALELTLAFFQQVFAEQP